MSLNFCKSADDSNTLFSNQYQEHYHSMREGALNESMQKHINPAFLHMSKLDIKHISILDICFGLGYNVLSTIYYVDSFIDKSIKISITSIELDIELIKSLIDFKYPKVFEPYRHMLVSLTRTLCYKDDRFDIRIINADVRNILSGLDKGFNIVYQDAFSYKKNPLLWTYEYFMDIKNILNQNSILTTYSISTKIRLALSENNFFIYDNFLDFKSIGTLASIVCIDDMTCVDMDTKRDKSNIKKPLYDDDIGGIIDGCI